MDTQNLETQHRREILQKSIDESEVPTADALRKRSQRVRYKKLGLCYDCGQKALSGRSRCSLCLIKSKERWRKKEKNPIKRKQEDIKRKIYRIENNICIRCGKSLDMGLDSNTCINCQTRDKHRRQSYKLDHKKQGLCVDCTRKALPGRIRCLQCLLSHNARKENPEEKKIRKERKKKQKEFWKKMNLCYKCGSPLCEEDEGKKTCMNCRQHITRPRWAYWHELRVRRIIY